MENKINEPEIFKPVLNDVKTSFKTDLKINFKNNAEKYEYLIIHNPQDEWITKFKNTKEYRLLYE